MNDTINYDLNNYLTTSVPNILLEVPKGAAPPQEPETGMVFDLAKTLARLKPGWKIIVAGAGFQGGCAKAVVFSGNEALGSFRIVYYPRRGLEIINRKLAAQRQRGGHKFTSDLLVARKLITANFVSRPAMDRAGEALARASGLWTQAAYAAVNARASAHRDIQYAVQAVIENLPPALATALIEAGVKPAQLTKIVEAAETAKVTRAGPGAVLATVLDGYTYVKLVDGDGETVMYAPGEAPPELQQTLTILKLSPDEAMVPGVGKRLGADLYLVLAPDRGQ